MTMSCLKVPGMRQNSILIHVFSSTLLFFCLPDNIMWETAIWTDDTALNSSYHNPSALSQKVEIAYEL